MLETDPETVILAWMWLTSNLISVPAVLILFGVGLYYVIALPWRQYGAGRGQVLLYVALLSVFIPQVTQTFFLPTLTPWWEYSTLREPGFVIVRFLGHLLGIAAVIGQAYLVISRRLRPDLHPLSELILRSRRGDEPADDTDAA